MSPVSSFDQLKLSGTDRTLSESGPDIGCRRPVNSREVLERLFLDRTHPADRMLRCLGLVDSSKVPEHRFLDRTHPVDADWTLVKVPSESGQSLTALSDTMAGITDRCVRSP